ncbi:carbon storage regulator [Pseudomonas syringae]|uniref:carbon storage regulator n=1 Tax=Pseudomonas syringae group TaxID=136849 RepID=UPI000CF68E20|nr:MULTISPECIES: carbon storage regulator [Pseudomonas syringae group]AVI87319.1 carbon storage regulator [Pseudomonas syringae pv. tomato]MBI6845372.1 carbon storage regulator [Pseudomonas syringae]QBI60902.1 carbon storage regulator [Pseudomonas syringae]
MLCLSRRFGESIVIGDNIKITVISGRDGQIRLGIDAPAELAVDRSEIRTAKLVNPRNEDSRHVSA